MSPAHTPGPWHVKQTGFTYFRDNWNINGFHQVACRPQDCQLATVYDVEANARLIAAAPELLAALAGCADALREAGKDFARANPRAARPNIYELHEQAARAAIAKATEGGAL